MNGKTTRRPLAELLIEMADSVSDLMLAGASAQADDVGLHPTSLSCSLPVETSFTLNNGRLQLLVGLPQSQERTYFDRPINRLAFHFEAGAT